MNESKRRKEAFPELFGSKDCPGAGIRPRPVVLSPRPVKFMPAISITTMPRRVGRMVLAIKRRRDLANPVGHLSKQLKIDEVTAAAWLDLVPCIRRPPRKQTSRVLSDLTSRGT